jgi:FKBP-type peptidyl-prolyl cis-trans isomerase SlyD
MLAAIYVPSRGVIMSEESVVVAEKVVLIQYCLKDETGEVLDQSQAGAPMPYLHGAGNIVAGLETALEGMKVGDAFDVTVPPSEGYGEKSGEGPQPVPKKEFPKGANLAVGMAFRAQGSDGQELVLYITKLEGAYVYVDADHPLAGKSLHFTGTIERIRAANADEKAHGHPHGPDGTHHHH